MKAVLLPGNSEVVVRDVADPMPGPDDAVIRVRASALCRSDMSLYYGNPIVGSDVGTVVPGHEAAGEVVEIGSRVHSVRVGDRVAVHLAFGCMLCEQCRAGFTMLCVQWQCFGFDVNGGDAEYTVVPATNCLQLPEDMSFSAGAVATDMVGTQYSAQQRLNVSGATSVAIFGLGPMGAAAVMVAKGRGAHVIAIDPVQARRDLATQMGADVVLAPEDATIVEQLRDLTGGGPHISMDCSGNPTAQNWALDATRQRGQVAFVGESRSTTINPSDQFLRKFLTVMGAWYFPLWQWDAVNRFVRQHHLPLELMVTHHFPLEQALEAFSLFDQRKTGKVVFDL